jgi:hypothetical protein
MWNLPRFRRSVRLSGHLGIDLQQTICPFVIAGRLPCPGPSSAGAPSAIGPWGPLRDVGNGGPRDAAMSGYLLRENPWLQLQGTRPVLLNVGYALRRSTTHSGIPALRSPSINRFAFDIAPRATAADIVKAGSTSSARAAASRASALRPRWANAAARQR